MKTIMNKRLPGFSMLGQCVVMLVIITTLTACTKRYYPVNQKQIAASQQKLLKGKTLKIITIDGNFHSFRLESITKNELRGRHVVVLKDRIALLEVKQRKLDNVALAGATGGTIGGWLLIKGIAGVMLTALTGIPVF